MSKNEGVKWAKKAYLFLSLAVVAVIWIAFFISLFFGRLSHGPVEGNWVEEVMKWVVMTPVVVLIVDGIFYALIATIASRKSAGIDESQKKYEYGSVAYKVFSDGVKIIDCYLIPKDCYVRELEKIRVLHPDLSLWKRSYGSLRREWATHSLLYSLGIKRDRTKDCDLNYGQKWYVKLAYGVVGTIALMIIK